MFSSRKLLLGASGASGAPVAITDPNHPAVEFMYTGDNVTPPTVFDETANSRDATINGSVSAVSGHIGSALDFGGTTSDYLALTYDGQTEINSGNFFVSFWVNMDVLSTFSTVIGNTAAASADRGYVIAINASGEVRMVITRAVGGSPTIEAVSSGAGITTGSYFHVLVNGDSAAGVEFFVNNVSVHTQAYAASLPSGAATRSTNIGLANWSTPFGPINGKIDMFRFGNRSLDSSERALIYNAGVGA